MNVDTVGQRLNAALDYHSRGNFSQALGAYGEVLAIDPSNFTATHMSGVAAHQMGRDDIAVSLIGAALKLNPQSADAYYNLGLSLSALGRCGDAVAAYDRCLALEPGSVEAYFCRGNAQAAQGDLPAAVESYRQVLERQPRHSGAWVNLGNNLGDLGQAEEAMAAYDAALSLDGSNALALNNRSTQLLKLHRYEEAIAGCDRVIEIAPGFFAAYVNRGNGKKALGRFADAIADYDAALALQPEHADAHFNKGIALFFQGDYAAAEASYAEAARRRANWSELHYNIGLLYQTQMRLEDAIASYDRALAIDPEYALAHWNRSQALLARGDFAEGWREYEWRWHSKGPRAEMASAMPERRLWTDVSELPGKHVLLFAEQGLGDTLQFCRYVAEVKRLAGTVTVCVQKPLLALLNGIGGADEVIAADGPLPAADYCVSLLTLPLLLGTTLATVPGKVPYIDVDPAKREAWKARLSGLEGLKVGLVWNGGFRPHLPESWEVNKRRNLTIEQAASIHCPQACFISLQKGEPAESELRQRRMALWPGGNLHDFGDELRDFTDTAALVANLDLVIAVDTSVAHLSGALGRPVWILNRFDSCWRWLEQREDSPWYPSAKLYRQQDMGDWAPVLSSVERDLKALCAART